MESIGQDDGMQRCLVDRGLFVASGVGRGGRGGHSGSLIRFHDARGPPHLTPDCDTLRIRTGVFLILSDSDNLFELLVRSIDSCLTRKREKQ